MVDEQLELELEDYDEIFLDFLEPGLETDVKYIARRVDAALEEFGFDEILAENDITEHEVLEYLFEQGYIGLPEFIEDEEIEDIQEV